MRIRKVEIYAGTVYYRAPFKISLGTSEQSDEVLVKIYGEDGFYGIGEASPSLGITGETQGSVLAVSDYLSSKIIGLNTENLNFILDRIHNSVYGNTSAKAAFDIALHDLTSKENGKQLYKYLGGYRDRILTDITIGIMDKKDAIKKTKLWKKKGIKRIKIKVGLDIDKDLDRIEAIRGVAGAGTQLFVDANQGWRPKEAILNIKRMEQFGIDFVEQPVVAHDIEGLAFVRNNSSVPIMADESVHSPFDAVRVVKNKAADMINIKLMKAGGISRAVKIANISEAAGIENMVGCMMEGSFGIGAGIHFALSAKNVVFTDLDSDMDMKNTLSGKVILPFKDGYREALREPGIGIEDLSKDEVKLVKTITKVVEKKTF
jgi:o-succinylbenzoate synthase